MSTTEKRKRGRPAIPAEFRRSCTLRIRVTPDTAQAIRSECKRLGCTVSAWLRGKAEGAE